MKGKNGRGKKIERIEDGMRGEEAICDELNFIHELNSFFLFFLS